MLSYNKGKPFKMWCLLPATNTKKAITLTSKPIQEPVMKTSIYAFMYNSEHHRFLLRSGKAEVVQVFWCDFLQFSYSIGYRVQDPNLLSPHIFFSPISFWGLCVKANSISSQRYPWELSLSTLGLLEQKVWKDSIVLGEPILILLILYSLWLI